MKLTCISICYFLSVTYILAQQQKGTVNVDVIPPSPNSSALLEYANIPVNYYTGTPEIDVPLYTLKGRHLELPISLSYHASGIKVDDIPSWVGTGWTLNAGGVITREVLGLPDEDEDGYCGPNLRGERTNDPVTVEYLSEILYENWDSEPDIFYFNFLGRTGRFVINAEGNPIMLPYQSLSIEPAIGPNSSNDYWTITDEKGVKYVFGSTISSKEYTDSQQHLTGHWACVQPELKSFISSWYLDRIEYLGDVISFTYATGSNHTFRINSDLKVNYSEGGAICAVYTCHQDYSDITIRNQKFLHKISSEFGEVELFESSRLDYSNLRKLDRIEVKNINNVMVKNIAFQYGYFSPSCTSADCKRLKLNEVRDITNNSNTLIRGFDYYEDQNLPPRNSYKIDHWGYYNNNPVNDLIPSVSGIYSGAIREPSLDKSKANSLKKIINPAGGYQEIIYELHDFMDTGGLEFAGGLRVSSIKEYPTLGSNPLITNYSYKKEDGTSSGLLAKKPRYHHDFSNSSLTYNLATNNVVSSCSSSGTVIYSHSIVERFDLNGTHVGYGRVVIENKLGGEEIFEYTNFDNYADFYDPDDYFFAIYESPIDPLGPPFALPTNSYFWARGMNTSYEVKNELGSTLKRDMRIYEEYANNSVSPAKGIRTTVNNFIGTVYVDGYGTVTSSLTIPGFFRTGIYSHSSKGIRLDYSEHYQYDQYGNESTYSKVDYTYSDTEPNFVKTETTTHPDGSKDKTEYKYAFDLVAPPGGWLTYALAIQRLNFIHDIASPIESIYSYAPSGGGFKVIGGQLNRYKIISGLNEALPETVYSLELDNPLSSFSGSSIQETSSGIYDFVFDSRYQPQTTIGYDINGNITSVSPNDGLPKQYIWGYNATLPIAQIEGVLGNNSVYSSFEKGFDGWSIGYGTVHNDAVTGSKSVEPLGSSVQSANQLPAGTYLVSMYLKNPNSTSGAVTISGHPSIQPFWPGNNKWQYGQRIVTLSSPAKITLESSLGQDILFDEVRVQPLKTHMTTFTYEPLIGLTETTDSNGKITTYQYDSRNRLHLIRDEDNNIVERYRYNYGNEDNELNATIQINGSNVAGSSQTIKVVGINAYGPTEIKWYDSNGSLLSTSSSFNHTFSGTGSKTVRLVLLNPEYDPKTIYKSKTFYNEWSVGTIFGAGTICSDGNILEPVDGGSQSLETEYYFANVNTGGTTCGVLSGNYSYQWQHNRYGGWSNFGSNSPEVELPTSLRTIGSFKIRVVVSSNCGSKTSSEMTIDVEYCPGGGGPPGGGGTGSGSWSTSLGPTYDEICYSGTPSSAEFQASINGTFSCSGLNYTYGWSIKYGSGSYTPLLGNGSQITITRSMLQSVNPSVYGNYTLRVQVTDNCSTGSSTKTSTATIVVPLDCSSGIGGPE